MSSFINLLDVVYPIGCVYTSTNSTSPATLFGGTWDKIEDMFLYSSTGSETTGGSAEHEHYWFLTYMGYYSGMADIHTNTGDSLLESHDLPQDFKLTSGWENKYPDYNISRTTGASSFTHNKNNGVGGSRNTCDQPNWVCLKNRTTTTSSLPPYLNCYMWKRTA